MEQNNVPASVWTLQGIWKSPHKRIHKHVNNCLYHCMMVEIASYVITTSKPRLSSKHRFLPTAIDVGSDVAVVVWIYSLWVSSLEHHVVLLRQAFIHLNCHVQTWNWIPRTQLGCPFFFWGGPKWNNFVSRAYPWQCHTQSCAGWCSSSFNSATAYEFRTKLVAFKALPMTNTHLKGSVNRRDISCREVPRNCTSKFLIL